MVYEFLTSLASVVVQRFTCTAVAFLLDLCKLAGDVCSVAVKHRCVPVADLPWVVQHNHLAYTIHCFDSKKLF